MINVTSWNELDASAKACNDVFGQAQREIAELWLGLAHHAHAQAAIAELQPLVGQAETRLAELEAAHAEKRARWQELHDESKSEEYEWGHAHDQGEKHAHAHAARQAAIAAGEVSRELCILDNQIKPARETVTQLKRAIGALRAVERPSLPAWFGAAVREVIGDQVTHAGDDDQVTPTKGGRKRKR